jgi:chromosome segregation ATPase
MLSKKIEQRKASLSELQDQEAALQKREAEWEAAVDEAKTDEEIKATEEEADKIEAEKKDLDEKKGKLEGEIAELEGELEQLNSKDPKNEPEGQRSKTQVNVKREDEVNMSMKSARKSHHSHGRHWGLVMKHWALQPHRASWTKRARRLVKAEKLSSLRMEKRQQKQAKRKLA